MSNVVQFSANVATGHLNNISITIASSHRNHLTRLGIVVAIAWKECLEFWAYGFGFYAVDVIRTAFAKMICDADVVFSVGGQS